jgi:arabinogalactan oligomer / maltooligosaccharide transport system substrate-binding protein
MKSRALSAAALGVAAVAVFATTAPAQDATTVAPSTTTTLPARGDADLVIWADETKAPVIKPLAEKFAAAQGIKVSVLEVKNDAIKDGLKVAGPAGKGPDIFVAAHDWTGGMASSGLIEPIDLGAKAKTMNPTAVKGFAFGGKNYGVPYSTENIALIRNTKLVPNAPKTFAELERVALSLKKAGKVKTGLAVQNNDPYHEFPLFSSLGGYVFGQDASGSYNAKDLGIDSKSGLAGANQIAKWIKSGLLDPNMTYDVMIQQFGDGQAAFAITGPWAVNDQEKGFKTKGVSYAVSAIPPVKAGINPAVFVGVQGFMISSFSKNKALAKSFVLDELTSQSAQTALFAAGGRPPANTAALKAASSDPDVKGFGASAVNGRPMPNISAMDSVWGAWTDAYKLLFTGQGTPDQAFKDAATKIRTAIASS